MNIALIWIRAILLLLATTAAFAVPRPDTRAQLQRLVRLPNVQLPSPLEYYPATGFIPFPDDALVTLEVARIRKELKGASNEGLRHIEIALLYESLGHRPTAIVSWLAAREFLRGQIAVQSSDVPLLIAFARTLVATSLFDEAAHYLARAARLDPSNSDVTRALATLQQMRAWRKLVADETLLGRLSFIEILIESRDNLATPSAAAEIRNHLDTASELFAKAIAQDSTNPTNHLAAAEFSYFKSAVIGVLESDPASLPLIDEIRPRLFSRSMFSHLQHALDASKSDPVLLAKTALLHVYSFFHGHRLASDHLLNGALWQSLPDHERTVVQNILASLENIAESESKSALLARDLLACFQWMIMRDYPGAEQNFRLAINSGAKSDRVWDYYSQLLSTRERFPELIDLCEERVQSVGTTRNRVFLARAYDRAGQDQMAEISALLALRVNPNDFLANLTLASLLLKKEDASAYLARAFDALTKASKNLGPHPSFDNMLDLAFARTIYYALTEDFPRARKILNEWLAISGENKDLRAASELIGY